MPPPTTSLVLFTVNTYTLLVSLGVVLGFTLAATTYRMRHIAPDTGSLVDVGLLTLATGIAGGRIFHVALNWHYFRANTGEISDIAAGGINWHGALVGVLAALWGINQWQGAKSGVNLGHALDALAPALPFIGLMTWWGCGAAVCSYGAEIERMTDYPAVLTWVAPGEFRLVAPRFATQPLGMAFSGALLLLVLGAARLHQLERRRFWAALAVFAAGMFGIDAMRGDYALKAAGLRADQWLDGVFAAAALGMLWQHRHTSTRTRV